MHCNDIDSMSIGQNEKKVSLLDSVVLKESMFYSWFCDINSSVWIRNWFTLCLFKLIVPSLKYPSMYVSLIVMKHLKGIFQKNWTEKQRTFLTKRGKGTFFFSCHPFSFALKMITDYAITLVWMKLWNDDILITRIEIGQFWAFFCHQ